MTPPPADIAVEPGSATDLRLPSLAGLHSSIPVPGGKSSFLRKLAAFAGPGYLVAVGYMDPGNWATDLAGGSAFGYSLLWVIFLSNIMAMVLQSLAAKLGIVTGMDLAQACRAQYRREIRAALWLICEAAIVACDLAEVIGTAIALNLLFGIPLLGGVVLTAFDVILILHLQKHGFRKLEAFVIALLTVIALCFAVELAFARPSLSDLGRGLVPSVASFGSSAMLYVAIGIVGATVMPHNLYLHSAVVQTRDFSRCVRGKSEAIRFATIDSCIALGAALFINAAILVLSAAAFHSSGRTGIVEIQDAYRLLSPVLGAGMASFLFAVALLASGQNSTVTATLAGQVVMEGFLNLRLPAWQRRLATRALAIVPAAIVAGSYGAHGTARLLILSQVILSLQLPFAVVPLVRFTSDRKWMGKHVNSRAMTAAACLISAAIIVLNLVLIASLI